MRRSERFSLRRGNRRQPARLLALTSLALLLSLVFASAAAPQGENEYTATVAPVNVIAGTTSASFTFDITNTGTSGNLGAVDIDVPDGFASAVVGTVTAPEGKTWTATESTDPIELRAEAGSELVEDEAVSVQVTVDASTTTGAYEWTTAANSAPDGSGDDLLIQDPGQPSVEVMPGPLGSFEFDTIPDQTAGTPSDPAISIQAKDIFGNDKTDYNGSPALTGNLGTPTSCTPDPCPIGPNYDDDGVVDFSGGTGTADATITAYVTGNNDQQLTLTDTESDVESDSGPFTVNPGPLGSFTIPSLNPVAPEIAGEDFDATVTAFDLYGNQGANGWNGADQCVVFSGPLSSPKPTPAGTLPDYPDHGSCSDDDQSQLSFNSDGQATANITLYRATTANTLPPSTTLTVKDATETKQGSIGPFEVNPNEPDFIAFDQEPTLTEALVAIDPAPSVRVEDQFGNVNPNESVTMEIKDFPEPGGSESFTDDSSTSATTNSGGIATFGSLKIAQPGLDYTIEATVETDLTPGPGTRSDESGAFNIANDVNLCSGTCSATGSTPKTAGKTTAFGLGGGSKIGITVASSVTVPPGVCGSTFDQLGDGFGSSSVQASGQPSFKIEVKLSKSEAQGGPASAFDICLGAFNTTNPPGEVGETDCDSSPNPESWMTKDDSCAVLVDGFYWGLVADYPSSVKDCPKNPGSGLFPGIVSRRKSGAGEIFITVCAPHPWDEKGGFG